MVILDITGKFTKAIVSLKHHGFPPNLNRVGIHKRKEKKKAQKRKEWKEFKCCLLQLIVIFVRYLFEL
jgi:hypothetical protein